MTIVNVSGVGEIELPDGMSQDDMQKAIMSHPDVIAYQQNQPKQYPEGIKGQYQKISDSVDKYVQDTNLYKGSKEFVRGVPILGKVMEHNNPDNQSQLDFQENNPNITRGLHLAGGIASTAPLAGGLAGLLAKETPAAYEFGAEVAPGAFQAVKQVPSMLSSTGNYLKQIAGQSGLFGGIGGADALAAGKSSDDVKKEAVLSAIGGGLGPTAGKIIGPGIKLSSDASKTIGYFLGALAGGKLFGLNEAILGALPGESGIMPKLVQRYFGGNTLGSPTSKAILSTLGAQAGRNAPDDRFNYESQQ